MYHVELSFHSWLLRQKHSEYRHRPINLRERALKGRHRIQNLKYHLKHISFLTQSWYNCEVKVAQSCPTLSNPRDYTVHVILQTRMLEWAAVPFSRGLPNPGIKPRSPTLQANSLPSELPAKPKNTGVGSLALLQRTFLTQEIEPGSPVLQADSLPAELPVKPQL